MKLEYIICIAAVVFCVVVILQRKKVAEFLQKPETIAEIKKYCIVAEQYIVGTKKGQERLELVCARLRDLLPSALKPFVTTKMLVDAVNYVFEQFALVIDGHKIMA